MGSILSLTGGRKRENDLINDGYGNCSEGSWVKKKGRFDWAQVVNNLRVSKDDNMMDYLSLIFNIGSTVAFEHANRAP